MSKLDRCSFLEARITKARIRRMKAMSRADAFGCMLGDARSWTQSNDGRGVVLKAEHQLVAGDAG